MILRERLYRWWIKKGWLHEGERMRWWQLIIVSVINPCRLLRLFTAIALPAAIGIRFDFLTDSIIIAGVPYSRMWLDEVSRYYKLNDGKAFMYKMYSPDVLPNMMTIVQYTPPSDDFNSEKIEGTIRVPR